MSILRGALQAASSAVTRSAFHTGSGVVRAGKAGGGAVPVELGAEWQAECAACGSRKLTLRPATIGKQAEVAANIPGEAAWKVSGSTSGVSSVIRPVAKGQTGGDIPWYDETKTGLRELG